MYKQLRITHECIVLVLISLVNNERTNKIIKNSGIDSRWDTTKWRFVCVCICNIFNSKKWVSPFLICDLCYDFYFLQQKGDERKRNETRFDTITVSLKAIWLVLGSIFYLLLLLLICAELACFSYVWKILAFSRYNLTASKLLSFSRFFSLINFALMLSVVTDNYLDESRPASCSSLNSHLFVFLPVFCGIVLSVTSV